MKQAVLWGAMVCITLVCQSTQATISDIESRRDPEFQFDGGLSISTKGLLNHSWVQIRFGSLGVSAVDFVLDSAGIVIFTEDGNIAPPENFPSRRPTGVFNMTPLEWHGFVASIETLEIDETVTARPTFLPATEEVGGHFSQVLGVGTDHVRLADGIVPADPTPGTMPDAAILHWNLVMSLPSAGKYRVRQWPTLTPIPEPATLALALLGTVVGTTIMVRRRGAG